MRKINTEQEAKRNEASPSNKENSEPKKTENKVEYDMDAVIALFEDEAHNTVELTAPEIVKANRTRKEHNDKYPSFQKSQLYRTFHTAGQTLMEIIAMMPKHSVRMSDIILEKYAELIRWTAAAYEHDRVDLKHLALNESISLMNTVTILCNVVFKSNLIGKKKSTELSQQCKNIARQIVAWRGSLNDLGDYGTAE